MDTGKLSKSYSALTALERFKMYYASQRRGDNVERLRIVESASYAETLDFFQVENDLVDFARIHFFFQMAIACEFWLIRWRLANECNRENSQCNEAALCLEAASKDLQARFIANREGFDRFLKEAGMESTPMNNAMMKNHRLLELMDVDQCGVPDPLQIESAGKQFQPSKEPKRTAQEVVDTLNQLVEIVAFIG
jgi:hypothetical protein